MQEYDYSYLIIDVILLADIFEYFPTTILLYYELDPSNMYSASELACSTMMKLKWNWNYSPTLLSTCIESGIRGGIAMIPNPYNKQSNPLLLENDEKLPTNYLMYLDCTNLYCTAITFRLPISDFKSLQANEIKETRQSTRQQW